MWDMETLQRQAKLKMDYEFHRIKNWGATLLQLPVSDIQLQFPVCLFVCLFAYYFFNLQPHFPPGN